MARLIDETGYTLAVRECNTCAHLRQLSTDVLFKQELVGSSITRLMDERVEKLERALELIVERRKLQLDLDYATRTVSTCLSCPM